MHQNRATAIFRIDNPPSNFYIDWHNPSCDPNAISCATQIIAFQQFIATATVIDLSTGQTTEVSATALFEDGS